MDTYNTTVGRGFIPVRVEYELLENGAFIEGVYLLGTDTEVSGVMSFDDFDALEMEIDAHLEAVAKQEMESV